MTTSDARGVRAPLAIDADRVRPGTLRPHLARSAVFAAVMAVFVVVWLVGLTLSTLSALSMIGVKTAVDLGPSLDSGLSVLGLGGMALVGIGWLAALMVPVREFVAGGAALVSGAGDAETEVRDDIAAALRRYAPPLRLTDDDLEGVPALLLCNEHEWALLAARSLGPDLHIGWTMWRNRSTLSLVGAVLGDMLDGSRAGDRQLLESAASAAMVAVLQRAVAAAEHRTSPTG